MSSLVLVKDVYKRFMGENVLDGVNLEIKGGDKIAMMGPNGAGKTTLIRAIMGFYHIDGGVIEVDGMDPIKDRVEILKRVSFIPQLPPPIKLNLKELLLYIAKSSGIKRDRVIAEAREMDLNMSEHMHKPFYKLSGGMKQKLLIAIALAKRSSLLIFDEPTANLDPKGREQFYTLLSSLDKSISTIFITHRADEIEGLVNREVYMDLGKVVEDVKV
jgi:ABC-2 type transport system ATP-binding protein